MLFTNCQGWEETVDCCLSYLLRTVLSGRGGGDSGTGLTVPPLAQPPSTDKVKKHISLVLDKMTKGGLESSQLAIASQDSIGRDSQ